MSNEYFKQYPSGLRLVVKEMSGFFSVSTGLFIGVGSRIEQTSNNGYSHFIEHMTFKGTKKRTALQISQEIDRTGGSINAYTSKDCTCYHTKTGSADIEKSLDILADMLFDSLYSETEMETERKVILEEINIDEDAPEEVCHDLLSLALFGQRGLGQTIIGCADNVKSANRDGILEFRNKHYTPDNIVISIAGNVSFEKVERLVERYFESRFSHSQPRVTAIEDKPQFYSDSLLRIKKDVEQSHIALGYPSIGVDDETYYPTIIMANILGGGMSSRLFQVLREQQGLAYSVYAFPSLYADCGYLEIYCGTNPQKAVHAYKTLNMELEKFAQYGATEEEFEINKSQFSGGNRLALESTMAVMRAQGSYLLRTGNLINIEERIKQVDTVTFESVQDAIKTTLSATPAKAYVGKKIKDLSVIIPNQE